ncbi:ABC transporter substrate-binding protein [Streptomyces sp. NPDC060194]|uniref:ABC transporter substrate-binding protein n=1 Tax=Streptomyces sp. NPDC060194 TaxID=3347069 RepID=UPI00365E4D1C
MRVSRRRLRTAAALTTATACLALTTACGADNAESGPPSTLDLWARAGSAQSLQRLADAWNKTHETPKVKVTQIPEADYVTKFAAAAGAKKLPDLVGVDVVYMPQFVQQGLLTDLTDRIDELPYGDALLPAHQKLATRDDKTYGVPAGVDVSSLFWNKDLFRKAGLDPEKPPTNWAELKSAADKVDKLGDGVNGFYYSGNSTGANAFTWLPLVWASGGSPLGADGKPNLDTPEVKGALSLYRDLDKAGDLPKGYDGDTGTHFISSFQGGKIGIQLVGSFAVSQYVNEAPDLDFGVTGIPGKDGGQSSFAGGDIMAIPAGAKHTDDAWKFMEFYLSEKVQVETVAKSGALPVRTDLADNKYTSADPRVSANAKLLDKAQTPVSTVYNQLFNDPNGPFLAMLRKGVQGGDPDAAAATAQKEFGAIAETAP